MNTFSKTIIAFAAFLLISTAQLVSAQSLVPPPPPPQDCALKVGMYAVVNTYKMNVMIEKDHSKPLTVTLRDKNQKLVHKHVITRKTSLLSQKIDFASLDDGMYYLTISDGTSEIIKEIKFNTNEFVEVPYRTLVAVN